MRKIKLNVLLHKNRDLTGHLRLEIDGRVIGIFKILGRGSRGGGDTSLRNKGNTPTGTYDGNTKVDTSKWSRVSYGPNGAIRLKPIQGKALLAESLGRSGLLIHGGDPGSEGYWRGKGALRATHGCLRLSNLDMKTVLQKIAGATYNYRAKMCQEVNVKVVVSEY